MLDSKYITKENTISCCFKFNIMAITKNYWISGSGLVFFSIQVIVYFIE